MVNGESLLAIGFWLLAACRHEMKAGALVISHCLPAGEAGSLVISH